MGCMLLGRRNGGQAKFFVEILNLSTYFAGQNVLTKDPIHLGLYRHPWFHYTFSFSQTPHQSEQINPHSWLPRSGNFIHQKKIAHSKNDFANFIYSTICQILTPTHTLNKFPINIFTWSVIIQNHLIVSININAYLLLYFFNHFFVLFGACLSKVKVVLLINLTTIIK